MALAVNVTIKAADAAVARQVEKILAYYLTGVATDVSQIRVTIDEVSDPLGVSLMRCQIDGDLVNAAGLSIVETQSSLNLAITRALERCVRTIRRRQARYRFSRSA